MPGQEDASSWTALFADFSAPSLPSLGEGPTSFVPQIEKSLLQTLKAERGLVFVPCPTRVPSLWPCPSVPVWSDSSGPPPSDIQRLKTMTGSLGAWGLA